MRNMKFDVKNHPTKETAGVTTVSDEHVLDDGTKPVIEMGELTKKRGEDGYRASFLNDGELVKIKGLYKTRSQAGHAVRAKFEKELRTEKANARKTTKTAKTAKPVTTTVAGAVEQSKKDKRNARRRELRAAKKAAA